MNTTKEAIAPKVKTVKEITAEVAAKESPVSVYSSIGKIEDCDRQIRLAKARMQSHIDKITLLEEKRNNLAEAVKDTPQWAEYLKLSKK